MGLAAGTGHSGCHHVDQDAGVGLETWFSGQKGLPLPHVSLPSRPLGLPLMVSTKSTGPTKAQVVSECTVGHQ